MAKEGNTSKLEDENSELHIVIKNGTLMHTKKEQRLKEELF
jgi:hypothetical protein